LTDESIERYSAVPYYQQLGRALESRISSGAIQRGARLPSEGDLSMEFGLSRATVRQAMQFLESRGAVKRIPNRGVFACEPAQGASWYIHGADGFLENAIEHHTRSVVTHIRSSAPAALPSEVCESLELSSGSVGFKLVRLRYLDDIAAVYSTNYSPPDVAPVLAAAADVLTGNASLTALLARAGFSMGGAERIIRARFPPVEVAEALRIEECEPLVCIRSTSWTVEGFRYDSFETWVRSDVIPLEVTIGSAASSGSD
jgi:GntR family transcriptional regulator